ncbi:MAG: efflux RND transporter periplasmic adaptor subunit [Victivallales bacterium]|nr:efflux RND transporter periplasmic adaptor subunit [Victivallales bacterium]
MASRKRLIRITVGIILLIVFIISVVPNFYSHTSSDGIITARTTTITSPIEGVLHFQGNVRYGDYFRKGQLIGEVLNDRIDFSYLQELITEKKTLEGRIASFSKRIVRYNDLNNELKKNVDDFQKFSVRKFESQIKQAQNKIKHQQAEFERAKKEYSAVRRLEKVKAVRTRELEKAEANFLQASERLRESEEFLKELENYLAAINTGIFLGQGNNDSPYSKQRMDQLVIELALADTAVKEARNRVEGIDQQIEKERERIQKVKDFRITAPFNGLIWQKPLTEGSTVVIGSELIVLLDCSSIFLEVMLSEVQFDHIKAGQQIKYRLYGDVDFYTGNIVALRGAETNIDEKNKAAVLKKDEKKEFRIWIKINPEELDLKPENFYQVGRHVEVRLPRKFSISKELIRFWNVF